MKKNKLIAFILSGLLTVSALPGGVFAASVGEDSLSGVYTGTARGYKSDISVTVTIGDDKKITDITADGDETPSKWEQAIAILEKIKKANGTDGVDTVSGATVSSKAIIDATDKAIMKAFGGFTGGTGTAEDPYLISRTSSRLTTQSSREEREPLRIRISSRMRNSSATSRTRSTSTPGGKASISDRLPTSR